MISLSFQIPHILQNYSCLLRAATLLMTGKNFLEPYGVEIDELIQLRMLPAIQPDEVINETTMRRLGFEKRETITNNMFT